jgi:hypothetical protein
MRFEGYALVPFENGDSLFFSRRRGCALRSAAPTTLRYERPDYDEEPKVVIPAAAQQKGASRRAARRQ